MTKVTKYEVKSRTPHDPQVINNSDDYKVRKEIFVSNNKTFILSEVLSLDSRLENFL